MQLFMNDARVDLNAQKNTEYGETAAMQAACFGHDEALRLLIQSKADLSLTCKVVGMAALDMQSSRNGCS